MSSKRQISSCKTNLVWGNILKRKWQSVSRISKLIENMKLNKLREEANLLNLEEQTFEYFKQEEKIIRLTILIKHHYKIRNDCLEMIKNISFMLTKTTC